MLARVIVLRNTCFGLLQEFAPCMQVLTLCCDHLSTAMRISKATFDLTRTDRSVNQQHLIEIVLSERSLESEMYLILF